jgi:hypothetical protein
LSDNLAMAWTQQDFDNVEAAIRAVRDGQRKTSLSSESGALTYMNTPLPDLIKLRDAIMLELNAAVSAQTRRSRVFLTRHRRGL